VTNEFSTAAFRFGHSLLQSPYFLLNARSQTPDQTLNLRNIFNNIELFSRAPTGTESLLRGLTAQRAQSADSFFTEDITNQLFNRNRPFGLDLVSLNTQRGRDHGLPPYNDVRELCGLGRATSFFDLARDIPEEGVRRLQAVYASPDDIDLYVGGFSEFPVEDAVIGPTFLCIVGDQFTRFKRGDRFFYEFGGPQGFTPEQLDEIRQVSFARILCDNTDVGEMQPLAFVTPSRTFNSKFPCNSPAIPKVNLFPWRGI
jgi:peroxidase